MAFCGFVIGWILAFFWNERKNKNPIVLCKHCKMDSSIRNPSGFCDHLHYPKYCKVCNNWGQPIKAKKIKRKKNGK